MSVSSSRVISVLTAAAVVSVAGLVSFSGGGASAQPTGTQPATTQPTTTKPTQPTQPTKPVPPPAKPGDTTPPPPPPPPGPDGEKRPERGPSVGGAMKGIDRSIKQLQKQVGDTKKREDNLRLVGEVERNIVSAKNLPVPHEILDKVKDDAEKAKLQDTFRKQLVTLMRKVLDLEMFVMEGKTDAANQKVLDIIKFSDESHEMFHIEE